MEPRHAFPARLAACGLQPHAEGGDTGVRRRGGMGRELRGPVFQRRCRLARPDTRHVHFGVEAGVRDSLLLLSLPPRAVGDADGVQLHREY